MSVLRDYIEAWARHDIPGVLGTLADDCEVIECYGPVYRGRDRVEQWMHAWFEGGGTVVGWTITSEAAAGDTLTAEWTFTCISGGSTETFDGATVARVRDGRLACLREYRTTAALYDWDGAWRE